MTGTIDRNEWNFALDDDDMVGRPANDTVFMFTLRQNRPVCVRFLSAPHKAEGANPKYDKGIDWVSYRELDTRGGLSNGVELPRELRFGVPVQDYILEIDPASGRRMRIADDSADPLTAGATGRTIFRAGESRFARNGRPRVSTKWAINVVDMATGRHKIMKTGQKAAEALVTYFQTAAKQSRTGIDVTETALRLLWTRKESAKDDDPSAWTLMIDPVWPGDVLVYDKDNVLHRSAMATDMGMRSVVVPEAIDLPEPVNISEMLREQRAAMDGFLLSLTDTTSEPPDWAKPDAQQSQHPEPTTAAESVEPKLAAMQADDAPSDKYDSMSPARLRSLLSKAGLEVPRGTTKADLIEKARDYNL